jgi:FKBP-type peptidyl-prolyl cis-trans isomerase SlyD
MKIEADKAVFLTYQLSIKDASDQWESIETVTAEEPMAFIHGLSGLPEKFEDNLQGLEKGSPFDFSISSEDGYGDFDPEAIVDLPMDIFKDEDGNIQPEALELGNMIPMTNEDGSRLMGQVIEVADDYVVMDFNHPLAGREMWFKGEVLDVREATKEELDHGHIHGTGGVEH